MARSVNGPWFRASKGTWYVTVEGKSVSLSVKGEGNRKEAVKAWHRLLAEEPKPKAKEEPKAEATVKEVVDAFLSVKEAVVKATTHYVYGCLLQKVTNAYGKVKAIDLKASDVLRWVYSLNVSASTRSDIAGVLASAFKWAEGEGLIPTNPLKAVKRPAGESRGAKAVVTEEAHAKLCEAANTELRLLLTLLHETGARPSELSRLTAQDVDCANSVAILTDHKTAHTTGRPRIIVLTALAITILQAQATAHPTGPLLRNSWGNPWDKDAIGHAMRRASKKAKVKGIAYGYRHGFATDALAKGIPDATVAALLGHSSTAMLHKHYSHLTSRTAVLKEAVDRIR